MNSFISRKQKKYKSLAPFVIYLLKGTAPPLENFWWIWADMATIIFIFSISTQLKLETAETTDYGHMKAKSQILCGPNSNPTPKINTWELDIKA